ncbi:unnamed protein product [Moneuplotes crassus]|uniref:Uncharacterized protein n=1 Tax=Euplotes crassus TaxID=5936 RepID=A0AAD1UK30_EUPCR|nr:unnamed protein product [Moneuplotes crassus]
MVKPSLTPSERNAYSEASELDGPFIKICPILKRSIELQRV